jgi:hypothetical protein
MTTHRRAFVVPAAILGSFALPDLPGTAAHGLLAIAIVLTIPFVAAIGVFGWCALRGIDPGPAGRRLVEVLRLFVHLFRRHQQ